MTPTRLICIILSFLFIGCSRHNDSPNGGGNPTPQNPQDSQTLKPEIVPTQIIGVAKTYAGNPSVVQYVGILPGYTYWPVKGGDFSIDTLTTDKYFAWMMLGTASDEEGSKTITLTPSGLNYVRIKPIRLNIVGNWVNGTGGTFGTAATGTLTLPPNAIMTVPANPTIQYPYYGPDIKDEIKTGYLSPLSPEFGLSNPGYPAADMDGQRWYLSSAGIIEADFGGSSSARSGYQFYPTYTGTLKMPIASGITAPDSIPYWRLTAGKWTRSGMAHKSGDSYVATIHEFGVFNFAQPLKGAYTTLQLRTSNNVPLINATFRVKANNLVLLEGQTDWEGNALMFLPSGVSANLEIQYAGGGTTPANMIAAGGINTANLPATLTVNVQSPSLICTLSGTANNCDGSAIKNGMVIVKNTYTGGIWYLKVVNGAFKSALVDGSYEPMIYTLTAVDKDTRVTGADTAVSIPAGGSPSYMLNTCPAITNLYMNYSVDGVAQTITGNRSNSQSPLLQGFIRNDQTFITAGTSTKGLQFATYGTTTGVRTGSGISSFIIDGKYYNYIPGKPMRVTFDRYDLINGGLIIGSADFYYNDNLGAMHHLQCSFQVVRVKDPDL
ncbi:MAG: hypothetical protein JST68_21860 [Bacteroidetes bacterium]|nr:hypothetical protein [Bacteroidota bacterium]